MKIKKDFMIREVAGTSIVVPVGEASLNFNGLITLNETGTFLFKILKDGATKDELLEKLLAEYEIDEDTAKKDIDKFIDKLSGADLLE